MRNVRTTLLAAATAAVIPCLAHAQVVLNETFDDGQGLTRFDTRSVTPTATNSATSFFDLAFNYGNYNYVSYAFGSPTVQPIPSAPGSTGSSTIGAQIRLAPVVPTPTGTVSSVIHSGILPTGVTVADNFRVEGYVWHNYNGNPGDQFSTQGGAGSTEYSTQGLRRSGDTLTGPFGVGGVQSPGYAFTATSEGGTVADVRLHNTDAGDDGPAFFKRNGAWFAGVRENRFNLTTGDLILAGTPAAVVVDTPDNHAHSYYRSEVFPASEGFEIPGAPAKKWVEFEVEQHGRITTHLMNGKAIGVLFNSESFSGTPQFGHFDRFNGLAPDTVDANNGLNNRLNQFVLYDNLQATQLPAAATNTIPSTGNYALFNAGGTYDAGSAATISYLEIGSADAVTIQGAGTLTLGGSLGAVQSIGNGTHTITKPVSIAADTAISVVDTGTLEMTNVTWAAPTANGLNKNGAGTLRLPNVRAQYLMFTDGKIQITGAGPTNASKVSGFDVGYTATAQLDVGRTVLAVDYVARASADPTITNSPLVSLQGRLNTGFAPDGDGNPQWNGPGIVTSAPEVQGAGFSTSAFTVRIAEASALGYDGGPLGSSGLTIDSSTVLLGFTFRADTNLDQSINFGDLLSLAQNYNGTGLDPLVSWIDGDSTGDGNVNFSDLLALAQVYGQTIGALGRPVIDEAMAASFDHDWALAQSLVPEPTSLAALAMAAGATLSRRRRPM